MTDRLHVILARAGVASRRGSERLIAAGRVRVNGKVVREQGVKVDPNADVIEVDGQSVRTQARKVYLLLYKPAGYITTVKDPHGRPTVRDLIPVSQRIYPVGRLDADTEGLLLLTNDGEITNYLTHPRYEHEKEYLAQVKGSLSPDNLRQLREGILLEDGLTAQASIQVVSQAELRRWVPDAGRRSPGHRTLLRIVIHEGRKRQIRRMLQATDHRVDRLIRVRMGSLTLGNLRPGEWRYLSSKEVAQLQARSKPRGQTKKKPRDSRA